MSTGKFRLGKDLDGTLLEGIIIDTESGVHNILAATVSGNLTATFRMDDTTAARAEALDLL